jgi:hypothetical protein
MLQLLHKVKFIFQNMNNYFGDFIMNTKELVTKIFHRGQYQLIHRVDSLHKLLPVGLIFMLSLLPLTSTPNRGIAAYAQQVQLQTTTDPWYQSLETAHSKVEAALSPGAFGHGVPSLQNLSTNEILIAIGIPVVGCIIVFMAVRALLKYMNTKKMGRASLLKEIM